MLMEVYTIENMAGSFLLITSFFTTLIVILNGTKFKIIVLLTAMMMVSNVGTFTYWFSRTKLEQW